VVSLDDAVVARFSKGGHHFEILVDPNAAVRIKDGEEIDIIENLAIEAVFKDAAKGDHAGEETIKEIFKTSDVAAIARRIITEGEIQLTADQRRKMVESKRRQIIDHIVRNSMNPQTKTPHPRTRIELALEEARIHVDPFKSTEKQVEEILKVLRTMIPIRMDQVQVAVRIPAEYSGKSYGAVKEFGELVKEQWQPDGSWVGVIKIPAGMQIEFYDHLNAATKGNVETKLLG